MEFPLRARECGVRCPGSDGTDMGLAERVEFKDGRYSRFRRVEILASIV
jgi:hypothetical protein